MGDAERVRISIIICEKGVGSDESKRLSTFQSMTRVKNKLGPREQ